MSVWEALAMGIVQGITEFLPVSSSGHLVLLQKIFGIREPALAFDTALHAGTMLAVIVVLRKDIWNILRRIVQPLTAFLIIATIPAVFAALFFRRAIEDSFQSASFLGFAFLVTSTLLFISEALPARGERAIYRKNSAPPDVKLCRKSSALPVTERTVEPGSPSSMTWIDALVIGLFQAIAVFPGVSRSGSTISGALIRKLDRDFAARFSFLLSIPAIFGALVLQAKDLFAINNSVPGIAAGSEIGALPLAAGTVSASIVAFFSVSLAIKLVREHSLRGFAFYTGLLGLLILADKFVTHWFF
jgi:undecaprenyl-diphosphatase